VIVGLLFPNKVSSKCPAIMFAVRRTASAPGRITFLIVSIHTMNGIRVVSENWIYFRPQVKRGGRQLLI
jgi:succinate dehydrogenase hydrophobic anchor subunit